MNVMPLIERALKFAKELARREELCKPFEKIEKTFPEVYLAEL